MTRSLDGLTIMVVEDDFLAALELKRLVEERAGKVAGPVGRLEQAEDLAQAALDGAILDVKLDVSVTLALAEQLIGRGVPLILVTGYDAATLPERFADLPRLSKPFSETSFDEIVGEVFAAGAASA